MIYLKVKSHLKKTEVSHISECLCVSPEVAEALVKSWQEFRGENYRITVLETKEVNPKHYPKLGVYLSPTRFEMPQKFSLMDK